MSVFKIVLIVWFAGLVPALARTAIITDAYDAFHPNTRTAKGLTEVSGLEILAWPLLPFWPLLRLVGRAFKYLALLSHPTGRAYLKSKEDR